MTCLLLNRAFLSHRCEKTLARVVSNAVCTYKHQYERYTLHKPTEMLVNNTKLLLPTKCQSSNDGNHRNSAIKIPRFLRKTKDKEQIDRYYLVKKLCLKKNFDEAILNMKNWLQDEPVTTSTILILNGLLYSLFEEGMSKDIVSLKRIMDRRDIKGDRSTYTVLIDSFGKMKNFQMALKLLEEMNLLSMSPHCRSYMVVVELMLGEKLFSRALEYFLQIESIYKEIHDGFCALFISTLVTNKLVNAIDIVFQDFMDNKTRVGEKTMLVIEKYFHSGLSKDKWKASRTTVSTSGICQYCEEKLEKAEFGKPDKNLSLYFQKLLNHELSTNASGKRSYHKDQIRKNKVQELFRFLEEKGPFRIVVDGLNVAMHPSHGLDFQPLFRLVENFSSQGEKVLIIAANELIHPKRSKAISTADHQKAMDYLRTISAIYFVKHNKSGIDDLFLINAALHLCRQDYRVKLISNDKFMDHRVNMKPQTLSYFKRWLSRRQVMVHWYDRTRMKLCPESKTDYALAVQKTDNSWHFPSTDENTWMCVQRIQ